MSATALKLVRTPDTVTDTEVYSYLDGPIESLSMLRHSLVFAELANLSYLSRAEAGILAHRSASSVVMVPSPATMPVSW